MATVCLFLPPRQAGTEGGVSKDLIKDIPATPLTLLSTTQIGIAAFRLAAEKNAWLEVQ
jgi:hypothetical protein